jgi:hypothetical protein
MGRTRFLCRGEPVCGSRIRSQYPNVLCFVMDYQEASGVLGSGSYAVRPSLPISSLRSCVATTSDTSVIDPEANSCSLVFLPLVPTTEPTSSTSSPRTVRSGFHHRFPGRSSMPTMWELSSGWTSGGAETPSRI